MKGPIGIDWFAAIAHRLLIQLEIIKLFTLMWLKNIINLIHLSIFCPFSIATDYQINLIVL